MTRAAGGRGRTFAAFANPNFRRFFIGQAISQIGTWMQNVGQSWLVYQLTGSGTELGVAVALQSVPLLILGPYGGVVADRVDKRRLVIALQATMGIQALVLAALTLSHVVQVWQVFALSLLLGVVRVFEIPTRQAFLLEMVGPDDLRNAVSLNSILPNSARAIGPAVAGVIIALVGVGACFLVNAVSFIAIVAMLMTMDLSRLVPVPPTARARGQLREGFRYVLDTPVLSIAILMTGLIGAFAVQWQVMLPILAKQTFGGGPETYGFMMAALGTGAVGGALYVARHGRIGLVSLSAYAGAFCVSLLLAALAPTLPLELVALSVVGIGSVTFMSSCNATLQLSSIPQMRGRVLALWLVAGDGLNPIGAPAVGRIGQYLDGRAGLVLACTAAAAAAAVGFAALRSGRRLPALPDSVA